MFASLSLLEHNYFFSCFCLSSVRTLLAHGYAICIQRKSFNYTLQPNLETLQYYRNSGSNVFSCLLDASKAFDRVHYGKLFNILLSKKLPICIIRMLLDCYVRQESRASWSSYYTDYFTMSNGVKQGRVLFAILFTLYLDKLLIRLKNSNIGCSINGCYAGALCPYHTLMI